MATSQKHRSPAVLVSALSFPVLYPPISHRIINKTAEHAFELLQVGPARGNRFHQCVLQPDLTARTTALRRLGYRRTPQRRQEIAHPVSNHLLPLLRSHPFIHLLTSSRPDGSSATSTRSAMRGTTASPQSTPRSRATKSCSTACAPSRLTSALAVARRGSRPRSSG